jgi:hypothetical protein
MNNQEKNGEDLLRQYINPDSIEMAPEEFTSKIMEKINIESVPLKRLSTLLQRISVVPLVSVAVTILLLATTFLIPASKESPLQPVIQFLNKIEFSFSRIDNSHLFNINLPVWLPYLFIGILFLTIFDRALNGIFHKEDDRKSVKSKT